MTVSRFGTRQHPDARDLSDYLVHLTDEHGLRNILLSGIIRKGSGSGVFGRLAPLGVETHSVSFTETPIDQVHRLAPRHGNYVLVFELEDMRLNFGATPVWYITDQSQQWLHLRDAVRAAGHDPYSPIWTLVPFIDTVKNSQPRHDWRWEREWRILGDLLLSSQSVVSVLLPDNPPDDLVALIRESMGSPLVTASGVVSWVGGYSRNWNATMELLNWRFFETFMDAVLSSTPDREYEHGFWPVAEVLSTEWAVAEMVPDAADEVHAALVAAVREFTGADLWYRIRDFADGAD